MTIQEQNQKRREQADKIVTAVIRLYNAGIITGHEVDQLANRIEEKLKITI